MATITYRKLDANGDPLCGNGQYSFVSDLQAVAQAILTRLKLLQGEWWEDSATGTPLFQSMLGVAGSGKHPQVITLLIQQRILGTPYVREVNNVSGSYNATTRAFSFYCTVQTQFGSLSIATTPTPTSFAALATN
jgi:hypothetical protein